MGFFSFIHLLILVLFGMGNYNVFLSFRGENTRRSFTDHLYAALIEAGIRTFRDDEGIRRGEDIESEIKKAIQESELSVIVFSKDYISSRWCLDELVMIMERRTVGHVVVPVFYDVDPSQVRRQAGRFGERFAGHEIERVEGWRRAVEEVVSLPDRMVLDGRHESPFIQDIVAQIRNKMNITVVPTLASISSSTLFRFHEPLRFKCFSFFFSKLRVSLVGTLLTKSHLPRNFLESACH